MEPRAAAPLPATDSSRVVQSPGPPNLIPRDVRDRLPRVPSPSTDRGNEESHLAQSGAEIPAVSRKLDLRGMAPPVKLAEARLEDLTIDGICGVY